MSIPTPIGMHVLIKPIVEKDEMEGGIIIPESVEKQIMKYEIIKLGTGEDDKSFSVKVGDKVIVDTKYSTMIKLSECTYKIVADDKIIAVIEE